jgi:hypothetical protein
VAAAAMGILSVALSFEVLMYIENLVFIQVMDHAP